MKTCVACAESIQDAAKLCKHCGVLQSDSRFVTDSDAVDPVEAERRWIQSWLDKEFSEFQTLSGFSQDGFISASEADMDALSKAGDSRVWSLVWSLDWTTYEVSGHEPIAGYGFTWFSGIVDGLGAEDDDDEGYFISTTKLKRGKEHTFRQFFATSCFACDGEGVEDSGEECTYCDGSGDWDFEAAGVTKAVGSATRRFEFVGEDEARKSQKASKFWEITVSGATVEIRFGPIGAANGQYVEKTLGSDDEAHAHAEKLIREKLKKGYVES